jgi:hypothetical protein
MSKLSEFVKNNDFSFGLPIGDTIIEIDKTSAEETEINTKDGKKKAYQLTIDSGESYTAPKSVMGEIKKLSAAGVEKVRITKTGEGLNTRYTVVEAKT